MLPPLSDFPRLQGLSLWKSTSHLPGGQPSGASVTGSLSPVLSCLHSCNLLPDVGPHPLTLPLPYLLRLLVTWLVPHPRAPGSAHASTPKAPGTLRGGQAPFGAGRRASKRLWGRLPGSTRSSPLRLSPSSDNGHRHCQHDVLSEDLLRAASGLQTPVSCGLGAAGTRRSGASLLTVLTPAVPALPVTIRKVHGKTCGLFYFESITGTRGKCFQAELPQDSTSNGDTSPGHQRGL